LGIALDHLAQAADGDTLLLTWSGANAFSRASVESRALSLGLDVIVVVAPAATRQEVNTTVNDS
jgi:hypothetical protein